ncbi:tyrosine-type recombinase/integrase [Chromohalobacter sp. HP20-39]|uniref:tyrosine-type recombinase/integrase n=1 Tax=Chromohalobacter sp. HP20-39 TaxID=3079306 RepID=UPI00294B64D3|nr:integrase arm-type DNA-binding domain-containing protein [Chromohalobacter sp. HP20-39]MDV6318750.1 tyrosine-type recombinase/integrase [Chromohalobacter sp. HP20-39]
MPLSDTKARKAKPREKIYRLADAHGLCLEVKPNGAKYWRVRYRLHGKANMWGAGEYPSTSLAEAREKREWARKLIAQGIHPREEVARQSREERISRDNTFGPIAEEWFSDRSPGWSDYYCDQVRGSLDNEILPALGKLPVRDIGAPEILEILQRIDKRGAPTVAINVRMWISGIFRYAILTLRAKEDPAEYVKGAVKRGEVKHAVALTEKQLRFLLGQIPIYGGYRLTQLATELLIFTMVRGIEMRRGRWSEVDFNAKIWRIPRGSMKRKRDHAVPLSSQAIRVLEEMKTYSGGRELMVPGMKHPNKPINHTTINGALTRMGFGGGAFATHGFRATASTIMNEYGWREDAIERQLAHVSTNKTRASYNHAKYMKERREMLQWWGDYIDSLRGQDAEAH